jgi:MraZ protein
VFLNTSVHTVDAKKRLFVPKRFQEELTRDEEGNLVAVLSQGQGGERCLYLFSEPGFERAIAGLDTRAYAEEPLRRSQRRLFSTSDRLTLDSAGRLLIPEPQLAFAGIEREVVLVGAGQRAEIWAREAWERELAELGKEGDIARTLARPAGNGSEDRGRE